MCGRALERYKHQAIISQVGHTFTKHTCLDTYYRRRQCKNQSSVSHVEESMAIEAAYTNICVGSFVQKICVNAVRPEWHVMGSGR